MTSEEEKANAIYASSRKTLDATVAADAKQFESAGIAISDECEHHHRRWAFRFLKPVTGPFGRATLQINIIYGQIPFMDEPGPIGLGYAAVAHEANRRSSGKRQVEFAEVRQRGLYAIVAEAMNEAIRPLSK